MNILNKFFGASKSNSSDNEPGSDKRSKYMPEIKLPIDEKFTINFRANGGKFLYCENLDEIIKTLDLIILENNWKEENVLILNENLKEKFISNKLNTTNKVNDASYFLTTCENLIANDGSLLICSNQIFEKKPHELPVNFIVFATTSQIVENISEGLRIIKSKHKDRIPTNITTIKHFKSENDDNNFLNHGSSAKNLYLLLLEDL